MSDSLQVAGDYNAFLQTLKERIRSAQGRAALSVNRELVILYWQIGRDILIEQQQRGWGAKVIDQLASDLRQSFSGAKGFSPIWKLLYGSYTEKWIRDECKMMVIEKL